MIVEKWSIGRFQFYTEEEYEAGLRDSQKLQQLNEEVELGDPEVALRIYEAIKEGNMQFESPIGEQFMIHLADILIEEGTEPTEKVEIQKSKRLHLFVVFMEVLALITVIVSALCFGAYSYMEYQREKQLQTISPELTREKTKQDNFIQGTVSGSDLSVDSKVEETEKSPSIAEEPAEKLTMLPAMEVLYEKNQDIVGWLHIDGTKIDYPVMQTPDNKEYYLSHDFEKNYNLNGLPILDWRYQMEENNTNKLIYGHYTKSGSIFGTLKEYKRQEYWKEHPQILFRSLYEEEVYEIIAVFHSRIYNEEDDVFKYYQFIQAENQVEFDEFIKNIKELSLYDTGVTAKYGDSLITLSTCDYQEEDGRLAVVGRKIEN